jgi:hypothetical protein
MSTIVKMFIYEYLRVNVKETTRVDHDQFSGKARQ